MSENTALRIRIAFEKGPEMRFTGHLDLQRTWERTLRRARLPVAYTQGFNPRARMQLSPALPLGCTSICELIDVWLIQETEPQILLDKLRDSSPPGIIVLDVSLIPDREGALQNRVIAVEYEAHLPGVDQSGLLSAAIETFLGKPHVERIRRGKRYDLRPLVEALECSTNDLAPGVTLRMRLASREGETGRPEELLLALGIDPTQFQFTRTQMFFEAAA